MPPIVRPFLLDDIAFIDELLEHAAKRLLGDAQDVEQVGNLHARVPVDEMQHPVMRAAEPEFLQNVVGVRGEVPVSKEQKFDQIPYRLARGSTVTSRVLARLGRKNYVSHVDIFLFD